MGHPTEDILYGLCQSSVRNYLNNVAVGKPIVSPVVFQGGVAFNQGIVRAFEEELETEIIVPPPHRSEGSRWSSASSARRDGAQARRENNIQGLRSKLISTLQLFLRVRGLSQSM